MPSKDSTKQDGMLERAREELAETLRSLFGGFSVPCIVNGKKGRAAFFDRKAQLIQAKIILADFARQEVRRREEEIVTRIDVRLLIVQHWKDQGPRNELARLAGEIKSGRKPEPKG
jgi:hypothetical protein